MSQCYQVRTPCPDCLRWWADHRYCTSCGVAAPCVGVRHDATPAQWSQDPDGLRCAACVAELAGAVRT